ncbi:MAG: hypothetical protein GY829_08765 [Gammaproteobacteria bacterium]|nr:hypothetical protein [Gammaproteobacteria bacterium]
MKDSNIRLEYFKETKESFLSELEMNGINFETNHPTPGVFYNAGESVQIITALGEASVFVSLATIIVQWLKARSSRKVFIQTKDKKVIHLETVGYSEKEVEKILKNSEKITVIDTKPND